MEQIQTLTDGGLSVKIDYISFTIFADYSVDDVVDLMGFSPIAFTPMPSGSCGYKCMIKHENISILYDGNEDMGIHVDVTGSSVFTLLTAYKEVLSFQTPFGKGYDFWKWEDILSSFINDVLKVGHFTRFDLAIDDFGANYFNLDDIAQYCKNGLILSKWRSYRNLKESRIADSTSLGHTIYFGSPKSEIMLRIYDKKLERNKALSPDDENYITFEWVRWELQLRKERACKVAQYIIDGKSLGELAIGILSDYFRIIVSDDSNKSRCSSNDMWEKFIGSVSRLRVTVEKGIKSPDERQRWFEKQMGRTVSYLFMKQGGDLSYFGNLAVENRDKLTAEDLEQLHKLEDERCCS